MRRSGDIKRLYDVCDGARRAETATGLRRWLERVWEIRRCTVEVNVLQQSDTASDFSGFAGHYSVLLLLRSDDGAWKWQFPYKKIIRFETKIYLKHFKNEIRNRKKTRHLAQQKQSKLAKQCNLPKNLGVYVNSKFKLPVVFGKYFCCCIPNCLDSWTWFSCWWIHAILGHFNDVSDDALKWLVNLNSGLRPKMSRSVLSQLLV